MLNLSASDVPGTAAVEPRLLEPMQLKSVLADIFRRILRCPDVNDEDDFFDLGGDSVIALSLISEVTRLTGHVLPVTALFEASSIQSIVRHLLDNTKDNVSNLVLLKPGQPETPLFIVHGLGGSVMELRELARHLKIKQMVYGIEACGLEGKSEPFDQVEAMAQFHIEQIKRLQPNGPYFLAGYSFGGLVALQMAQRLTAAGKKIAVLALIDTYPHAKYWPLVCRFCALSQLIFFQFKTGFWSRLINHYISVLAQMPRHSAALFLVQKAYSVAKTPFDLFKLGALTHRFVDAGEIENLSLAPEGTVLPIHLQKVAEASDRAFAAYRPRFYPGQITFFKAQGAVRVPFDAKLLWGSMCRKIMVHPVPGNHRSLIIDSAKHLAESLGACIDQEFHKSRIS